jgi:protein phosphatase 2C family protein 2/3
VNTYTGTIRDYNEDRVSIIVNVIKPPSRSNETWPKISYFAIFDGHGGNGCANYMKANLHHYVMNYLYRSVNS